MGLNDFGDHVLLSFVKFDFVDGIEHLFEIVLNLRGIRTIRKNLQKVLWGHEVEAWEDRTLTFEVSVQLLLTEVKFNAHLWELALENVILAALHDVLLFSGTLHNFEPAGIDTLEDLGLSGHGL